MKRQTTLLRISLLACLLLAVLPPLAAWGQSYTVRFVKGTDRMDHSQRTQNALAELTRELTERKVYARSGTLKLTLTALQNVVDRYDQNARALAFAQAEMLQDYLTGMCGLGANTVFDIHINAQTDLDNRVIAEVGWEDDTQTIVSPPTESDLEPFRKEKRTQATAQTRKQAAPTRQTAAGQTTAGRTVTGKPAAKATATKQAAAETGLKPAAANHFLLGNIGIGLKTNVLLFAGLLPDGSMYSPVVNAAAEAYFMDRFSAQLSFAYAMPYNKGAKTDLFSMTGFVVEPRWWLRGDGSYQGLYVGVYGQYGTFDVRIEKEIEDNCTGTFYGGGLSAGWLQPVWRGFFAEAGLQVGFRSDAVDVYSYTPGSAYKRLGSYTLNSFTLQGFCLGVGYRF